jgi:hypothetical protein
MEAGMPGRQAFTLQFVDEQGRNVRVPEGVEQRFGLEEPVYHAPVRGEAPSPRVERLTIPAPAEPPQAPEAAEVPAPPVIPQAEAPAAPVVPGKRPKVEGADVVKTTAAPPLPEPTAPAPEAKPLSRDQILTELSASLDDLPMRIGRFRQQAVGIYKVKPEVVRTKQAQDIPVATHEVGHHIHKLLWGTKKDKGQTLAEVGPLKEHSAELRSLVEGREPADQNATEGFAEFIRLYLTEPKQAQQQTPNFFRTFEEELSGHPDLKETLEHARSQIREYINQPPRARVHAQIDMEPKRRPTVSLESLYANMVDGLRPLQKVVGEMAEMSGAPKPPTEENAYELARLLAGWYGKADHFLKRGTFHPKTLAVTGKPLQSILKPVEGQLDALRDYMVSRRVIEKAKQGKETGVTKEDARATIKAAGSPEIEKAAKELRAYNAELLQYLVDHGVIPNEQAAAMREMNEEYIPFYRLFDDTARAAAGGKGKLAGLSSPVKRMKGSSRRLVDPLESIVKNTYTFISMAERNAVVQALVKQAAKTEGAGRWVERVPTPMKATNFELTEIKKKLEDAGLDLSDAELDTVATVFRPAGSAPSKDNIVTAIVKGKRQFYQVDPELNRVLHGLDQEVISPLVRLMSMPARALRLGATGISPEFAFRNPVRDAFTAAMQSQYNFKPGIDSIRGLFHVLGRDDLYWEWKRAGGQHAAMVSMDRTHLQQELDDLMASPLKNVARHPIEAMRMFGEATEAMTRVGEYGLGRGAGASPRTAALASREVSLDFARIGNATRSMNMITAFFNANIQGTDKFFREHKSNPKRAMLKGLLGLTLPSMILYMLNRDDPEYQELPTWRKHFFWNVPTKGLPIHDEIPFILIPKPFLWGMVYATIPESAMEWIYKKDSSAFDGIGRDLLESMSPSIVPTGLTPPLEVATDYNLFTDNRLTPGYLERLPKEFQTKAGTSEFSQLMARQLASMGIKVSPIHLDHIIWGYTAGAGRAVSNAVDRLLPGHKGKPASAWADMPVVRAFVSRHPNPHARSVERFYDRLIPLREKKAAFNYHKTYGKAPGAQQLTSKETDTLERLERIARQMAEERREARMVEGGALSPKEKRQAIDARMRRIIKLAQTGLTDKPGGRRVILLPPKSRPSRPRRSRRPELLPAPMTR